MPALSPNPDPAKHRLADNDSSSKGRVLAGRNAVDYPRTARSNSWTWAILPSRASALSEQRTGLVFTSGDVLITGGFPPAQVERHER